MLNDTCPSLLDTLGFLKFPEIPNINVDGYDDSWVQSTIARELKNASYKVDKVGIKKEKNTIKKINLH